MAYSGDIANKNPGCNGDEHYLMSPLLAPQHILEKFPKTMIQVSQNDPLRDYGILFALSLKKAGVDVKLNEHKNVPHGILNMNGPIFELKGEANTMIMECVEYI